MDPSFSIRCNTRQPKYQQVVNSVIAHIEAGKLKRGERIPSINELSEAFYLSRDTVEKAYKELRVRGIVSAYGKRGYFISQTEGVGSGIRVLLLLNRINAHRELLCNAFSQALGERAVVDLQLHHGDAGACANLLTNHLDSYHYYAVMPHFTGCPRRALEALQSIPREKLLILDKAVPELRGAYAAVCQHFEQDIYQGLAAGLDLLGKYRWLRLVVPADGRYPAEMQQGFRRFCRAHGFAGDVVAGLPESTPPRAGEAYLVLEDNDLVTLLKSCTARSLAVGKEVGIISYNDTPFKEILAGGITVLTTDFEAMGRTAASLLLQKKTDQVKNPFGLLRRNSL